MAILVFLNAWLISRLWFTFRDEPLSLRQCLVLGLLQFSLVGLLVPGPESVVLAASVVVALVLSECLVSTDRVNEGRLAGGLIVIATAVAIACIGEPAIWLFPDGIPELAQVLLPGLFGFLLVANEANLVIRVLLHRFQLEPQKQYGAESEMLDQREYNAGRVIGMLERWLVYLILVFAENYNVIALIVAAKAFARFRQMDQREFAEYVLIGTLTSLLLTVMIGQMIIYMMS